MAPSGYFGYFSFFRIKEEPTTKQHKETNLKPSGVPTELIAGLAKQEPKKKC